MFTEISNTKESISFDHIWKQYQDIITEVTPMFNKPFRIYEHSANNVHLYFNHVSTYGLRHLENPENVEEGLGNRGIGNVYVGCYIDGTVFFIATKTMQEPYLWHGKENLIEMLELAKKAWVVATSDSAYYAPNWKLPEPDWKTIDPIKLLKDAYDMPLSSDFE